MSCVLAAHTVGGAQVVIKIGPVAQLIELERLALESWQLQAARAGFKAHTATLLAAPEGALSGLREDAAATPLWLPTSRWQPGRSMRLEMSLGEVRGVQAVGVAVEDRTGQRLAASGVGATLWADGTIAAVARLS